MEFGTGRQPYRRRAGSQAAILRAIYHFGPVKRSQLSEYLGLTMPTITTNINDMIARGIVRETGLAASRGSSGRRARPVDIVPEARHFIGVEMQGSRWAVCLLDFRGNALFAESGDSPHQGYDENMQSVCRMIRRAASACGLALEQVAGIGICTPGLVNRAEGILDMRVSPSWTGKNIRQDIAAQTGYTGPVSVENNACARAYGVQIFQRELLAGGRSFAYLFISDGIACPLVPVTDDFVGSVVGMGELGHSIMDPKGPLCRCGNRGCLEAYSSDWAVTSRCAQALEEGKAPVLRRLCGGRRPTMDAVLEAQAGGDGGVREIIREAVYMLGLAAVNVSNFAGPSLMNIDGKLFQSEENRAELAEVVRKNLCGVIHSRTELVFAEPDRLSGAKGVAALAIFRDLEAHGTGRSAL